MNNKDDERLRKTTIAFLKDFAKQGYENAVECIDWLEKQSEQKSADKVEPKFKQGEWIIFNGLILYVDEVVQGYYRTISIDGIPNSYDWDIDNAARLWTVEDAKAGDVLVCCDNKPFIFKGFFGLNFPNCLAAYCGITLENQFRHCSGKTFWTNQDVKPATKEQRELLFQKMKEACYEWDAEKKELKPNNHVQWSDEEELHIKELESLVKKVWAIAERENDKDTIREMSDLSFFLKTLHPEKKGEQRPNPYSGTSFEYNGHTWGMCARDGGVEILVDGHVKGRVFTNDNNAKEMFIKALERVEEENAKGYKLTDCDKNSWWEDFKSYVSCAIEQKSAWSEEDENWLIDAINVCELNGYNETAGWLKNRLKSLKDRVQPEQEWSEEDERSIRDSIFYLKSAKKYFEKDDDILWDEKWFNLCIEWLESLYKKLRLQSQWKPSEDLPHWKKSTLPNDNTTGFNSDYFCYKGYCINYKELFDKLPKDE